MPYQEELIAHLISYKRAKLGSPPPGIFRHQGRELAYEHILPVGDRDLNFLEGCRGEIAAYRSANRHVKLHRYFHHLNSSQGFALNLFVPFFEGGSMPSSALLAALGQSARLLRWEPEAVPDVAEGTNLDAMWDTDDGVTTFCEVKLSERDFGRARNDERHRAKLKDIYLPRMASHLSADLQTETGFFGSYQILRNVWHMLGTPNGRLVFLIPRANARLWPMLESVKSGLSTSVRERVHAFAIEDVLNALVANLVCPARFRGLAAELRAKYVPGTT